MRIGFKVTVLSALAIMMILGTIGISVVTPYPSINISRKEYKPPEYSSAYVLPENQTEIWINRTIIVSEFLFVRIYDEINISNTKTRPFSAIQIYYPRGFWEKSITVRVFGRYKKEKPRPLDFFVHHRSRDYIGLTVKFYRYLSKDDSSRKNTFRVIIIFELKDVIKVKPLKNNIGLYLNITPCPFVPYPVKQLIVMAITPEDANPETDLVKPIEGKGLVKNNIRFKYSDIPPMNFSMNLKAQLVNYKFGSNISLVWSTQTPPAAIVYAERYVEISQSYEIRVEDKLMVSMFSLEEPKESIDDTKWKLDSVRVGLAPNVSTIDEIRDDIGKIEYENVSDKDINSTIKTIKIKFKRPIVAGEIRNVSIKYTIRFDEKFLEKTNIFNISIPLCPVVNSTLYSYSLTIKSYVPVDMALPINYTNMRLDRGTEKFLLAMYEAKTFAFSYVYPSQNKMIFLAIKYSIEHMTRSYLVLSMYVIIISTLVVELSLLLRLLIPRILPPGERERIRSIEQFIRAYETIIAYEKDTWVGAYENLIIKRPSASYIDEFRKRNSYITKQYEKLAPLFKRIKEYSEIYDYVIELEKLEERINVIKQIILSKASDFVAGKLETEVFKTRCEALLLELKDYLNTRERIIGHIRDFYLTKIS